ncbi:MAG: cupin domain-containing protein [Burkholderiales bacterium]
MRQVILAILLLSSAVPGLAQGPLPVMPESLHWMNAPGIPGFQFAWVTGTGRDPGPYVLRVKLDAGTTIPPHTHPDERHTIVLAGTLYVGFTDVLDANKAVAIPAGAVYVTPANTPHFVLSKENGATYQEFGAGRTGTQFIDH